MCRRDEEQLVLFLWKRQVMIWAGADKPHPEGKLALLQWRMRSEGIGLVSPKCWEMADLSGR